MLLTSCCVRKQRRVPAVIGQAAIQPPLLQGSRVLPANVVVPSGCLAADTADACGDGVADGLPCGADGFGCRAAGLACGMACRAAGFTCLAVGTRLIGFRPDGCRCGGCAFLARAVPVGLRCGWWTFVARAG